MKNELLSIKAETKSESVGIYKILKAEVVALYPSGKTYQDQSPTLYTDFHFKADFGEGDGEKNYTVRAPGNVFQYGRRGVIEVLKVSRHITSNKLALIYNPDGSFIQIATFE